MLIAADDEKAAEDRLVLLDGSEVSGVVEAVDSAGKITVRGGGRPLVLAGLRRIERPASRDKSDGDHRDATAIVELVGGGRIIASQVTLAGETFHVAWKFGEKLSLPIDAVRALRFEPAKEDAGFLKALAGKGEEFDQLFVKVNDTIQPIKGFLNSLDGENVVFEWEGQKRTLPRESLLGIVVAFVGRLPDRTGQCLVELADGSSLWGTVVSLAPHDAQPSGDKKLLPDRRGREGEAPAEPSSPAPLARREPRPPVSDAASRPSESDPDESAEGLILTVRLAGDVLVALPWNAVRGVTVRSDRLQYVSDLEPVEAVEQTIVAFPRPWRRDESIGGRTLTLGGRTFQKGIGVHARSLLVFETGGRYDLLAATIGVDDETLGKGDCVFVVLGDGKELFRKRMKAGDPPYQLRVELRGAERVGLLVEPGEDLDIADHADWCDACFIRGESGE